MEFLSTNFFMPLWCSSGHVFTNRLDGKISRAFGITAIDFSTEQCRLSIIRVFGGGRWNTSSRVIRINGGDGEGLGEFRSYRKFDLFQDRVCNAVDLRHNTDIELDRLYRWYLSSSPQVPSSSYLKYSPVSQNRLSTVEFQLPFHRAPTASYFEDNDNEVMYEIDKILSKEFPASGSFQTPFASLAQGSFPMCVRCSFFQDDCLG